MQEVCYWLLTGSRGDEIAKLALPTALQGVITAIQHRPLHYLTAPSAVHELKNDICTEFELSWRTHEVNIT